MKNGIQVRLVSFSDRGAALAEQLAQKLHAVHTPAHGGASFSLKAWTETAFREADALIFIGAVGIAVRAIAPFVKSKAKDPAVVVLDEWGRFAIPVLSGHLGGANDLARRLGALCGATPVITTATDLNGAFAVDEWAKRQNCRVRNPGRIKTVSAKLLAGESALLKTDWPVSGEVPPGVQMAAEAPFDFALTVRRTPPQVLHILPPIAVLGVGCRKGTAKEALEEAFTALCAEENICAEAVCLVCSIDIKQEEPGLLAFCGAHSFPFRTFSAEELEKAPGDFTASAFVQGVTGVDNVCERSAVLGSGGKLLVRKRAGNGVTMALAEKPFFPDWEWRSN